MFLSNEKSKADMYGAVRKHICMEGGLHPVFYPGPPQAAIVRVTVF